MGDRDEWVMAIASVPQVDEPDFMEIIKFLYLPPVNRREGQECRDVRIFFCCMDDRSVRNRDTVEFIKDSYGRPLGPPDKKFVFVHDGNLPVVILHSWRDDNLGCIRHNLFDGVHNLPLYGKPQQIIKNEDSVHDEECISRMRAHDPGDYACHMHPEYEWIERINYPERHPFAREWPQGLGSIGVENIHKNMQEDGELRPKPEMEQIRIGIKEKDDPCN